MNDKLSELLNKDTDNELLEYIKNALDKSDESPFWKEKILPFVDAILSVLFPLSTSYKDVNYSKIDLEKLGKYLSTYKVNLIDEDNLDFPVGNYNLHTGMVTIIKSLF